LYGQALPPPNLFPSCENSFLFFQPQEKAACSLQEPPPFYGGGFTGVRNDAHVPFL
jgi:hypothetical protein